MSSAAAPQLTKLRAAHPEWSPWLTLIERVVADAGDPRWEAALPDRPLRQAQAPLLARTAIAVPAGLLRDWIKRLLHAAAGAGTPALASLGLAPDGRAEAIEWLRAALIQDDAALDRIARDCNADSGALKSIAQLLAIPLLQACRRRWSRAESEFWTQSYCPLCGAWPALAEVRGIERSRYLRCGRCGEQWASYGLRCVFCNLDDHEQLLSLMSESAGPARSVEACRQCRGYLKSLVVLQAGDGPHVLLDDLASVDLDIAAIEQGFHRPEGLGYRIDPAVTSAANDAQPLFSWSRW